MKKKFLAIALAAAMAFTVAPAMPANTTVAEAEDSSFQLAADSLIEYENPLKGAGAKEVTIEYTINLDAAAAANGWDSVLSFFDTATNGRVSIQTHPYVCYNSDGNGGNTSYIDYKANEPTITTDEKGTDVTYKITMNAEGIKMYRNGTEIPSGVTAQSDGSKFQEILDLINTAPQLTVGAGLAKTSFWNTEICTLKNVSVTGDEKKHDITPGGGNEPAPSDPTPVPTEAPQTGGEKPATDFAGIETQPTFKYTFDSADEVKLSGDAAVADGILNLAKDPTSDFQKTYAQIDDFTSVDFSKGVTLTADVNVKGWPQKDAPDWTPIFMFGDGTLGGNVADATAAYHFSIGFSSQDIPNSGYFGNVISAPYTWDYFSHEENRNKWYTIAVTITPTDMTTYINGQAVQTGTGDYTKILDVFKVAKNNYLGASYWAADADFCGSLDNVGIYNVALSAEDMGKLTTAEKTDIGGPSGDNSKKKQILLESLTAKAGSKKVSGTFTTNVTNLEVSVQVNKGTAVKTTANGKKFSVDLKSKLKGGDKVTVTMKGEGYYDKTETATVKYTNLKVKKVTAKKNAKKITGTVTVKKATVKIKVGKKAYKKAKVSGKNFTLKVSKLKKGTKVTVKATKKNYVTATKSVKVK